MVQCWAEFPFLSQWQTEKVCLFVQRPLPHLRRARERVPCWRRSVNDVWSSHLWWSSSHTLSYYLCFQGFCALVSRSMRAASRGEGWLQALMLLTLRSLVCLFSIFPLLSTSISSSLHLLGNRNYLSPCKGASSIPWFIARCHRNGSFFDWIEGVPTFVSLPGHSSMW